MSFLLWESNSCCCHRHSLCRVGQPLAVTSFLLLLHNLYPPPAWPPESRQSLWLSLGIIPRFVDQWKHVKIPMGPKWEIGATSLDWPMPWPVELLILWEVCVELLYGGVLPAEDWFCVVVVKQYYPVSTSLKLAFLAQHYVLKIFLGQ